MRLHSGLAFAVLLLPTTLMAQAPPPGCAAAEFRQFDFWIGTWDVTTPDGKPAGTNDVTLELKSCVLHEHWRGAGGGNGESFNMYNRSTGLWHQTWVADGGTMLLLDGRLEGSSMVLTGNAPSRQRPGTTVTNRIRWTPMDGGRVRQLWDTSTDDGKTWQVSFDGIYAKRRG